MASENLNFSFNNNPYSCGISTIVTLLNPNGSGLRLVVLVQAVPRFRYISVFDHEGE